MSLHGWMAKLLWPIHSIHVCLILHNNKKRWPIDTHNLVKCEENDSEWKKKTNISRGCVMLGSNYMIPVNENHSSDGAWRLPGVEMSSSGGCKGESCGDGTVKYIFLKYMLIFWLCWVSIVASHRNSSPVVVHGLLLLQSMGSRACGLK